MGDIIDGGGRYTHGRRQGKEQREDRLLSGSISNKWVLKCIKWLEVHV